MVCFKRKTALCFAQGSSYFQWILGFYRFNDHIFKEDLQRHGMAAALMGKEELAIAIKNAVIIRNMMFTIVAVKIKIKLIEVESMPILGITLCFFYLANHSVIHDVGLLLLIFYWLFFT